LHKIRTGDPLEDQAFFISASKAAQKRVSIPNPKMKSVFLRGPENSCWHAIPRKKGIFLENQTGR
jgi:hypothetical protein